MVNLMQHVRHVFQMHLEVHVLTSPFCFSTGHPQA